MRRGEARRELERVLDVRPRPPTEFTEACIASAEESTPEWL